MSGGLGLFLRFDERGGQVVQLVREALCFAGLGLQGLFQRNVYFSLVVQVAFGPHPLVRHLYDFGFRILVLLDCLGMTDEQTDAERDAHKHQHDCSSFTFHISATMRGVEEFGKPASPA